MTPAKPDATKHNPDPAYVAGLVRATGLSQRECAKRLGVAHSTLKDWIAGSRNLPYTAQYALECLSGD